MAKTKRCPNCGASNAADAKWCNQCLEAFGEETPAPGPETSPAARGGGEPDLETAPETPTPAAVGDETVEPGVTAGAQPKRPVATVESGAFRVSEDGITWICSVCDNENPIAALMCEVCGTTFARGIKPPEPPPEGDPGTAALVSLFFPGAGHAYLKLWPQAISRIVVQVWVLAIVILALVAKGKGSLIVAITFGLVAFVLWVIAAHDAYREARGEAKQVVLRGRNFVYAVFGILGLLFVTLVSSVLSAKR